MSQFLAPAGRRRAPAGGFWFAAFTPAPEPPIYVSRGPPYFPVGEAHVGKAMHGTRAAVQTDFLSGQGAEKGGFPGPGHKARQNSGGGTSGGVDPLQQQAQALIRQVLYVPHPAAEPRRGFVRIRRQPDGSRVGCRVRRRKLPVGHGQTAQNQSCSQGQPGTAPKAFVRQGQQQGATQGGQGPDRRRHARDPEAEIDLPEQWRLQGRVAHGAPRPFAGGLRLVETAGVEG